jgi:DivIVA domain-containing protein
MRGVQNAITILEVLAVLAILFVFAAVATRDTEILKDAPPDDPDVELPVGPLQPEDIGAVRFGMVLRGYRMREVDDVLTRVAAELLARDERIAALEQALVEVVEPHVDAAERGLIPPAPEAAVEPEPPVFADLALPIADEPAPPVAAEPAAPEVPEPALVDAAPDSSEEALVAEPVLEEPVVAPPPVVTPGVSPLVAAASFEPLLPAAPAAPATEPLAAEERTAEVEPVPVPEPAPVDLPFEEPPQELPHWPQPALEPEPEPLVPEDVSTEPIGELTAPVDDAAFSSPADAFPEVQPADDDHV